MVIPRSRSKSLESITRSTLGPLHLRYLFVAVIYQQGGFTMVHVGDDGNIANLFNHK